ncbi:hypothetical protein CYLTODRAFT_484755 [Cylindrobasidium torrendii FP15055 ss-10]|uniref:Uncharacterized protein n=1 Tax=Cylindrobasidium torrendii FP15055 ss-10 TaxID=1314674 RepID=A0A0D7BXR2_9AGAR|nr:hypothetical protein CYLTODRAFT_484755 [Cylindrobasidium torrendii FP15055 ss-10]
MEKKYTVNDGRVYCIHGQAALWTSESTRNPGRKYFRCIERKDNCLFLWEDTFLRRHPEAHSHPDHEEEQEGPETLCASRTAGKKRMLEELDAEQGQVSPKRTKFYPQSTPASAEVTRKRHQNIQKALESAARQQAGLGEPGPSTIAAPDTPLATRGGQQRRPSQPTPRSLQHRRVNRGPHWPTVQRPRLPSRSSHAGSDGSVGVGAQKPEVEDPAPDLDIDEENPFVESRRPSTPPRQSQVLAPAFAPIVGSSSPASRMSPSLPKMYVSEESEHALSESLSPARMRIYELEKSILTLQQRESEYLNKIDMLEIENGALKDKNKDLMAANEEFHMYCTCDACY